MAKRPLPKKKAPPKLETPIDTRQKAIAEQEAKVRLQMAKYEKLIEDAPRLAKERARVQREQFVTRAARADNSVPTRAVAPGRRRYELNAGAPARERRLRAERNAGRGMFFILLLVFAVVVAWLYFTFFRG